MYRSLIPALALTTVLWAGAFSGTAGETAPPGASRPPGAFACQQPDRRAALPAGGAAFSTTAAAR